MQSIIPFHIVKLPSWQSQAQIATAYAGAKASRAVAAKPSVCVPKFRKAVADESTCATPSGKKSADIILKELAQRQLEVEQHRMPPPQGIPSPRHMPAPSLLIKDLSPT